MAQKKQLLSTAEFASETGISPSRVSKMIREGKIEAEKISGKWMIQPSQLKIKEVQALSKTAKPSKKQKPATAKKEPTPQKKGKPAEKKSAGKKAYSVAEFVALTYLTEYGVMNWLKKGRLNGKQNAAGEWLIDAANLDAPGMQRFVR